VSFARLAETRADPIFERWKPCRSRVAAQFPCAFPLKIVGRTRDGFARGDARSRSAPRAGFDSASMEMRASREGNYISLTCTVNAKSREQLDNLYRELSGHPHVVMVL
jgi:putative lipoic acid-binding regulatory protein